MSGSPRYIFIICQSQQIENRIMELRLQKFSKKEIHDPAALANLIL